MFKKTTHKRICKQTNKETWQKESQKHEFPTTSPTHEILPSECTFVTVTPVGFHKENGDLHQQPRGYSIFSPHRVFAKLTENWGHYCEKKFLGGERDIWYVGCVFVFSPLIYIIPFYLQSPFQQRRRSSSVSKGGKKKKIEILKCLLT